MYTALNQFRADQFKVLCIFWLATNGFCEKVGLRRSKYIWKSLVFCARNLKIGSEIVYKHKLEVANEWERKSEWVRDLSEWVREKEWVM